MKQFKYLRKAALCLVLMAVLLAGLVLPADAASKYMEGEYADFYITLDENGGATIVETWDCYFGGGPITRYRRHYTLPDPQLCEMEVSSIYMDGMRMELLSQPDDSRPEGCAAVYQDGNEIHIEMYLDALDETHSFEITYYVSNAVILYNDVAEFHWNLSSENEAFDIEVLSAQIDIPYGTQDHGLYFWGHGPEENSWFDPVVEDGMVSSFLLYAENVPADQTVGVRFAMPLELFPFGSRFVDEDALDRILEEEAALSDSIEPETTEPWTEDPYDDPYDDPYEDPDPTPAWLNWLRFHYYRIEYTLMRFFPALAVALCVIPLLMRVFMTGVFRKIGEKTYLKKIYRKRLRPAQAPQYYRSLPDDLSPALVSHLIGVYPLSGKDRDFVKKGNPFAATVLDLIERDLITMSRNQMDEPTYLLTDEVDTARLTDFEQTIVELYASAGADQTPMTTKEITQYMRDNYSWCKRIYKEFYEKTDNAFAACKLTTEYPAQQWSRVKTLVFAGVNALLIVLGLRYTFGFLPSLIVGVVVGVLNTAFITDLCQMLHPAYSLLTQDGENRYALWLAYAHFLQDFTTFEEMDVTDVRIWRRYLVYATALGCSEQVLANLKLTMPEVYEAFATDAYLVDYEDVFASAEAIQTEGGYTIRSSSSSSGGWDSSSSDDGWGGFSDGGGDSDSGSSGSDFD